MTRLAIVLVGTLLTAACAGVPGPAVPAPPDRPGLPPIPLREGPLEIRVRYPGPGAAIPTDSNFVFGSVGTGRAELTINGRPVDVAPSGAFLAYLPVPASGQYVLTATAGGQTRTDTLRIRPRAAPGAAAPQPPGARIRAGTIQPQGALVLRQGEALTVRFRGTPGARARLVLPDSTIVPLAEQPAAGETATGFMEGPAATTSATEYAATFPLRTPLRAPDAPAPTLVQPPPGAGPAVLELVAGRDTARAVVPLTVALLEPARSYVGVARTERLDGNAIGVATLPPGTPYHWFFPEGTRLPITGERAGQFRIELDSDLYIWVGAEDVRVVGPGQVEGSVGNVRARPAGDWVDVRIDTSERFPFQVQATDHGLTVSVYGARSRTNWIYLPTAGDVIERIDWEQASNREYRLHIRLAEPLWGWQPRWDERGNLVVSIRRPPAIAARRPLSGITVAVDAGHPPGGAIGPTGLTEAEANLAIATYLTEMLRGLGAEVVVTRPDTGAVGLYEREAIAERAGADLFVSVHNNAFGPGVNPFLNAGTSVLYNRPQSVGLAREIQESLLAEFGLRDLGVIHSDKAVIRTTSMPSVITETMFLMIPQQEAALRDPAVQKRIAAAHARGIIEFLRRRAP